VIGLLSKPCFHLVFFFCQHNFEGSYAHFEQKAGFADEAIDGTSLLRRQPSSIGSQQNGYSQHSNPSLFAGSRNFTTSALAINAIGRSL